MSANIYGVLINGIHHDISKSEKGAKNYATRNGYDIVTIRYNCGYIARQIAQRKNNKWQVIKYANPVYNN